MSRIWIALLAGWAGCAYVTRAEFLVEWDEDGDGWPLGEDCEPKDPDIYPGAPDRRGDGCDNDCGTELDNDGDDWPDDADCDGDDPTIYPCSQSEDETDTVDSDCDGKTTKRIDTCPGLDPDHLDAVPPCGGGDMIGWFAVWILTNPASAQQACIQPMSRIQLGAAIGDVSDALEASELVDARTHLTAIAERMPCLDEVLDPNLFALFARYNATVYYYGQDEDQALRWGLVSRLAEPDLAWDDHLYPEDHPVRRMIEDAELPASGVVRDKGLAPPKGGGIFVNGVFAARPEAFYEVPSLVQVFDRSQQKVDAFWMEGPAFHSEWTVMRVADVEPPSWWNGTPTAPRPTRPTPGPAPVAVAPVPSAAPVPSPKVPKPPKPVNPDRKPVPVVPIVLTLVLGGVSGGTYLLADSVASTLPDQRSPDDLTAVRSRANLLVMASGVSLAGAVGVGVGGILMSSTGVTIRF